MVDGFSSRYYAMRIVWPKFDRFNGEGTVFGSINKADFASMPFISPRKEVVEHFIQLVEPLDDAIEQNSRQIEVLAELRDTLLPTRIWGSESFESRAILARTRHEL